MSTTIPPSAAAEGVGSGGAEPPSDPKEHSSDDIQKLREEREHYRENADKLTGKLNDMEINHAKAIEDLEARFKTFQEEVLGQSIARTKQSELRHAAVRAGLADPDFLQLADSSAVTVGKDGQLEGADAFFKGLRETKPHWFGAPASSPHSSTPGNAPTPKGVEKTDAMAMSDADYVVARTAFLRR